MSCSNHSIQGEGEPRRRVPQCSLPKLGVDGPLDPSLTQDPLLLCVRGKEPQMTVTYVFIQCAKPVMTYTDDARTASSNIEHHHGLRVREQLAGNGWREARYACSLQAYERHPIKQNLITRAKGTVGSM